MSRRRLGLAATSIPLALLALLAPMPAYAGDITAFIASATPRDNWDQGFGGALTTNWFHVFSLEAEAARLRGPRGDTGLTSLTGSAFLSPPIGALTPYGGMGVGLYRETQGSSSQYGTLKARILGAKVRVGGLLVFKGEYRRLTLSGDPLLAIEHRLSAGAGIVF